MPSNDTVPNHASSSSLRTRRGGSYTRYLDIKDVIHLLRGVITYNFEDTFENNLFKITGAFVPDNMEEAQTMRF